MCSSENSLDFDKRELLTSTCGAARDCGRSTSGGSSKLLLFDLAMSVPLAASGVFLEAASAEAWLAANRSETINPLLSE